MGVVAGAGKEVWCVHARVLARMHVNFTYVSQQILSHTVQVRVSPATVAGR